MCHRSRANWSCPFANPLAAEAASVDAQVYSIYLLYFRMAQITLYLPDKIARQLKKAATKSGQSVSAFVADLATRELAPGAWPASFEHLYGAWEGDFLVAPDPPPDHVELP